MTVGVETQQFRQNRNDRSTICGTTAFLTEHSQRLEQLLKKEILAVGHPVGTTAGKRAVRRFAPVVPFIPAVRLFVRFRDWLKICNGSGIFVPPYKNRNDRRPVRLFPKCGTSDFQIEFLSRFALVLFLLNRLTNIGTTTQRYDR